jgi:hypothetical protein
MGKGKQFGGGDGPGGGVGEAGRGGEVDGLEAVESGAEGGTQGAEKAGASGVELTPEIGFWEAALGRDWREGDGEGAVGQVGAGVPVEACGRGEEDGALHGGLGVSSGEAGGGGAGGVAGHRSLHG